mmetsp:Transcript_95911/g.247993  ORF Transcript_95911/g.247993 Transcript_95911/m.247993 type:complete len:283 (-) Transcript_95911:1160-2008(-)
MPRTPRGLCEMMRLDSFAFASKASSRTKAPRKSMRLSETLRLVREPTCERCSMKSTSGEMPSPACMAEAHDVRSRDFTVRDCSRHSPRCAKTSAVKQFQPKSRVWIVLLPRSSSMHCWARLPLDLEKLPPKPVSAKDTFSRHACSLIAAQSDNWHFTFSWTPLKSKRFSLTAPTSAARSRSMRPRSGAWPALRHRRRLNTIRLSRWGPSKSVWRTFLSAASDRPALPARSISSTRRPPWIMASTTTRSTSPKALPPGWILLEQPVAHGSGSGTLWLWWQALK